MRPTRIGPVVLSVLVWITTSACAGATTPTGVGSTGSASGSGRATATRSRDDSPTFPVTITDDDGVSVTIEAEPRRIVTFAPSMTEIVFALGLGDRIVGVSGAFDDYPPEATEIQEIGGAGDFGVDPNIERVVALEPDLFLTIKGGDRWKERLRRLGIPVVTLDAADLEDLLDDIGAVGRLTGTIDRARSVVDELRSQANEVGSALARSRPVTCFYETFYPPLYTVGPGTFIYDLLERAGCDPVTSSSPQQYPEWSVEDLVDQSPDVYLVSSESGAGPRAVAARPGFDAIEAVAAGRVVSLDADLVERPGPRIGIGLGLLAHALHPEAFA